MDTAVLWEEFGRLYDETAGVTESVAPPSSA
jgi:hypothetical protein